ncbi:hypothetical protein DYQ86_24845 [Acidobacteria bacterium AB60]|nr:hypothetical protein DYQ86_24845 [Acidobacteria bacterium AB60]
MDRTGLGHASPIPFLITLTKRPTLSKAWAVEKKAWIVEKSSSYLSSTQQKRNNTPAHWETPFYRAADSMDGSFHALEHGRLLTFKHHDTDFAELSSERRPPSDSPARILITIYDERLSAIFPATVEATEEAIVNAMVGGWTITGMNGHTVIGIPHGRLARS